MCARQWSSDCTKSCSGRGRLAYRTHAGECGGCQLQCGDTAQLQGRLAAIVTEAPKKEEMEVAESERGSKERSRGSSAQWRGQLQCGDEKRDCRGGSLRTSQRLREERGRA